MVRKKNKEEATEVVETKLTLSEKQKRLDAIAADINSRMKKNIVGRLSDPTVQEQIKIEFIPSASPELNDAVGGGFPRGKMTIISGAADSGKTNLALNTIGERMMKDPEFTALWLESEFSLDYEHMIHTFNIDPDRFVYVPFERDRGGEEALNQFIEILESGAVDFAVVNTLRALIPSTEIHKKMEDVDIALSSRMNSRFMGKVIPLISKTGTSLVVVQQRTTQIGGFGYGDNTTLSGGLRIRYQSMLTINLRRGHVDAAKDPIGPEEGVKIIGRVEKNHCVNDRYPYVKFEYCAIYGKGIEKILSTLQLAVDQKVLRKAGSHIYWDDENGEPLYHWTGKNDFREFMLNNEDVFNKLTERVSQKHETLSEDEVREIQKEEREEARAIGVPVSEPEE